MRYKRNFNNLYDSIALTILTLFYLCFYFGLIYLGVFHARPGTDPVLTFIVGTIVFGLPTIALIVAVITACYEYWYLTDTTIFSKKLFRKRKIIQLDQIEKVEKKEVSALVLGMYSSKAYIIYGANTKITVLLRRKQKHYKDIDEVLSKYLVD